MDSATARSRSKLWLGFGLMCIAVVGWSIALRWAMGSAGSVPTIKPGASSAEIDAAMAAMGKPFDVMLKIMLGQAISGTVFIAGMVVTGLGMIDYAAEARARG